MDAHDGNPNPTPLVKICISPAALAHHHLGALPEFRFGVRPATTITESSSRFSACTPFDWDVGKLAATMEASNERQTERKWKRQLYDLSE